MTIVLHTTSGTCVTYSNCELLNTMVINDYPQGPNWLRFKGTNDMGKEVVLLTSLRAEIYEQ